MSLLDNVDQDVFSGSDIGDSPSTDAHSNFEEPLLQNTLIGHQSQKELLLKLFETQKMPHGWIFSGTKGIGKETFCYQLVKHILRDVSSGDGGFFDEEATPSLNTDFSFDVNSSVVSRIQANAHGDLLIISPDEGGRNEIKVESTRKVVQFLQKTSSEGGWRIVVINDADRMNNAAQNALLKILEEPPKKTLLMLIVTSVAKVLPTIRSRCRLLPFQELTQQEIVNLISLSNILAEEPDLNVDEAYAFSKGSFGALQDFLVGGKRRVFETLIEGLTILPKLDRQKIIDVSHKINADKHGKDFLSFMELWCWWIENLIKDMSGAHHYTPILTQEKDIIATLRVQDRIVEKLLTLWDELNALKNQASWANHDRQTVILNSYYLFENLFKK